MTNSAIHAVVELAASQHGVITRRQAADVGVNSHRVATALDQGWLTEPFAGVLVISGSRATFERAVMAATLAAGAHGAASHRSAARLHRLDGFTAATAVEVSVDRSHRWRSGGFRPGTFAHHIVALEDCDLVTVDGILTTNLARTLADLGSVVRDRRLVGRALTDARRRGSSLAWLRETADRLHRPGQRGTGVLLRQLDAIPYEGRVPESWFEELLALCLHDDRLPDVVPQYEIFDDRNRFVARVDLAVPSVKLGLEAHSRRFHFGPLSEPLDEQRDLRSAAAGWELLYLGWYATKRPAEVLESVVEVVEARRRNLRAA